MADKAAGGVFAAAAALVVGVCYLWIMATQNKREADRFVQGIRERINEAFPDAEPDGEEECPVSGIQDKPIEPPGLPPGGAPEPPPEVDGTGVTIGIIAVAAGVATGHKPVIPGQQYSDQTCDNARLQQLRDQLTDKKKKLGAKSPPFKPPKKPYDLTDPKQAAKQALLCAHLRNQEQVWQELINTRDQIQNECFNSPKLTQDEIDRDDDHKRARKEANDALRNVKADIAFYNCP